THHGPVCAVHGFLLQKTARGVRTYGNFAIPSRPRSARPRAAARRGGPNAFTKNEMYRALLRKPTAILAANIYERLSARIAQIVGYELLVLSGSVGKASNLAAPDLVISALPDVQDHVRRITRTTDIPIMIDAEDGFGNALNIWRCV